MSLVGQNLLLLLVVSIRRGYQCLVLEVGKHAFSFNRKSVAWGLSLDSLDSPCQVNFPACHI